MNSKILFNILVFTAFFANTCIAQSSSSYTRFGIGDIDYSYSIRKMGMGQLGVSVADVDFISTLNPASLHRIGKTRIEFSMNYNGTFLQDNFQKNYYSEADFGGFAVGVPISNDHGVGVAFGIVPFSNVSYKVVQKINSPDPLIGEYSTEYTGKGGLSKIFVGSSYLLPIDLSIGASFDYYFGNIVYNSRVDFANSSYYSGEYEKFYEHRGIGGSFGLISPDLSKLFESKTISDFRFGLALNLFSKIIDDSMYTSISTTGIDTLNSGRGNIDIPAKLSLGLSFILNSKYLFSFDYTAQALSKFKSNEVAIPQLRDAYKLSVGFEYRHLRELGSTFWEQIIFRAGLSYEQTQYFVNNYGINQYSASLGASLPLSSENTLDIGLMYAKRGTKESNLFQEDIIKLGIGFSLGELWFLRQDK